MFSWLMYIHVFLFQQLIFNPNIFLNNLTVVFGPKISINCCNYLELEWDEKLTCRVTLK